MKLLQISDSESIKQPRLLCNLLFGVRGLRRLKYNMKHDMKPHSCNVRAANQTNISLRHKVELKEASLARFSFLIVRLSYRLMWEQ